MKQSMCYFSNDGKFYSIDKRAVQEYELETKINEIEKPDLVSNMIDNAQWFYEFFNEICYPESCWQSELKFVEVTSDDYVDINIGGKGVLKNDC
jgi:hypothetical protein